MQVLINPVFSGGKIEKKNPEELANENFFGLFERVLAENQLSPLEMPVKVESHNYRTIDTGLTTGSRPNLDNVFADIASLADISIKTSNDSNSPTTAPDDADTADTVNVKDTDTVTRLMVNSIAPVKLNNPAGAVDDVDMATTATATARDTDPITRLTENSSGVPVKFNSPNVGADDADTAETVNVNDTKTDTAAGLTANSSGTSVKLNSPTVAIGDTDMATTVTAKATDSVTRLTENSSEVSAKLSSPTIAISDTDMATTDTATANTVNVKATDPINRSTEKVSRIPVKLNSPAVATDAADMADTVNVNVTKKDNEPITRLTENSSGASAKLSSPIVTIDNTDTATTVTEKYVSPIARVVDNVSRAPGSLSSPITTVENANMASTVTPKDINAIAGLMEDNVKWAPGNLNTNIATTANAPNTMARLADITIEPPGHLSESTATLAATATIATARLTNTPVRVFGSISDFTPNINLDTKTSDSTGLTDTNQGVPGNLVINAGKSARTINSAFVDRNPAGTLNESSTKVMPGPIAETNQKDVKQRFQVPTDEGYLLNTYKSPDQNLLDRNLTQVLTAPREMPSQANLQNQVHSQIVKSFSLLQHKGMNEINLQLKPEFLGNVSINLMFQNGEMIGKIAVAKKEVKAMIENQLGTLKTSLAQLNLKVDQIRVVQETTFQVSDQPEQGQSFLGQHNQSSKGQWSPAKFQSLGSTAELEDILPNQMESNTSLQGVDYLV